VELGKDRGKRQAFVTAEFNLLVLLPKSVRARCITGTCSADGRWMELAEDRVQYQTLVLTALKLWVLLK
jgi:hypothetical protein